MAEDVEETPFDSWSPYLHPCMQSGPIVIRRIELHEHPLQKHVVRNVSNSCVFRVFC